MLRVVVGNSDAHPLDDIVDGLASGPEVEVIGVTSTGRQTVDALKAGPVDVFMFPVDWFNLARMIRSCVEAPARTSYVVAAITPSRVHVVRALQYGYEGVVAVDEGARTVSTHLASVAAGDVSLYDHPSLASLDLEPGLLARDLTYPTPLDADVAELIASGLTDGDIAETLSLPLQTVRNRVEALLSSNELSHRTQLAILQVVSWKIPDFA
jgi:DNA-binding NarL/FixJ family response regulator